MINPTVERLEDGGWSFTWDAGTPPYSIWLEGRLLDTTEDEEYEIRHPQHVEAPPDLEILNSGDTSENDSYPPHLILQWRGVLAAFAYVVEQYISATWTPVASIQESGRGYYTFRSEALDDGSSPQYRVLAVDLRGNTGTPLSFTTTIIRNPEHPSVSLAVTAGDVVVDEA